VRPRGRQRTPQRHPSRVTMGDRYEVDLLTQKSLLLGEIEDLKRRIDTALDNFTEESTSTLKKLTEELSNLTTELNALDTRV
jgi:hypothetical protein